MDAYTYNRADALAEATATAWYAGRTPPSSGHFAIPGIGPGEVSAALPGTVLAGRYQLEQVIGAGGFATVHVAWDLSLRRRVAIKIYSIATAGCIPVDEAKLQATCQHPNLMPLYDSGTDPRLGVTFLVMPLYPGADLASVLNRYGPMPFRTALLCVDQICGALDFLWHRRQVIHGDIKPANIWLTQSGTALLMDFNLYGLLARSRYVRAGTPGFTAPEVLAGRADSRSDVFSLGCVLYQCLAGTAPFSDDQAVSTGTFLPLHRLRPDTRPELERVIHTALAVAPEDRFQTPREFRNALRHPAPARAFVRGNALGTLAGATGRTVTALYRLVWKLVWRFLRHAWRRPYQALIEGLVAWCAAQWALHSALAWFEVHRAEVELAAVCLPAGIGGLGYLHYRAWRRR
jgi:hypothetical protein